MCMQIYVLTYTMPVFVCMVHAYTCICVWFCVYICEFACMIVLVYTCMPFSLH